MSTTDGGSQVRTCVYYRDTLGLVGDRWSLFVLEELATGTKRFNELYRAIDGISQRMLTIALRALERGGLVSRQIFPVVPPRVEYTLTDLGASFHTSVSALYRWTDDHLDDLMQARSEYDSQVRAARLRAAQASERV